MYVSEVGAAAWEEINEGRPGGNYGWPDTEGPFSASQYPDYLNPVYAYRHDRAGQAYAITGAVFYDAPGAARSLPAEYDGEFFFADLAGGADAGASDGWIKTFDPVTRQVRDFGTQIQRPVDLDVGPDGALYYLSNSRPGDPGHVYRIASAGQASDLNIAVQPEDVTASVGRPATFSVTAAGSGALSYQWQRNGEDIPGATSAAYELPSAQLSDSGATFRVIVSNGTQTRTSDAATLTVTINQPPVPVITLPAPGRLFSGGQEIAYAGTAEDEEDGVLPPEAFTWRVDYLTGDIERQGMFDTTGSREGTFTAATQTPFTSTDVRYRFVPTVRDSEGLEASTSVDLHPAVGTLNVATSPEGRGLKLTLDGQPFRGTGSSEGVVGVERVLVAPPTQTVDGVTYQFGYWSDWNNESTRMVVTGAQPLTVTAHYTAQDGGSYFPDDPDLTALIVAPPKGTVVGGARARVLVRVTNAGGHAVSGPVRFAVFASPDGFLDADDRALATVDKPVRLRPGRSRNVPLVFSAAADVPAGDYTLLVRADAAGAVAEMHEWNNVAASAAPVAVSPPTVDLNGSLGAVRVTGTGARRRASATLLLRNDGNSRYNGPVAISLLASPDATADDADTLLATLPARTVRIKAGGQRVIRLRANVSSLAAGTYHLVARAPAAGPTAAVNPANNAAVSTGTFIVA